jgi:anti-sigma factor RsiW
MSHHGDNTEEPAADLLAAYVDGELDAAGRARVEAWLSRHADAAAEIEGLRRLARLWQASRAPDPGDKAWADTLSGIDQGLPRGPWTQRPARPGAGFMRRLVGIGGAAAAALLLLALIPLGGTRRADLIVDSEEPYPVASAEDVEIISLEAADLGALVVGELPMREPVVAAAPSDVRVRSVLPDKDGMMPTVRIALDDSAVPIIVAPIAGVGPRVSVPP